MELSSIVYGFFVALAVELFTLNILKFFLFYTIIEERHASVFTLFGKVEFVIDQPGLYLLWPRLTWKAFLIPFMGKVYKVDLRIHQVYLRSQPVNSEEGAPMGIGIWYEMFVKDPLTYLFKNTDPNGSLAANVSNATVRSLSNLPLSTLLTERHNLSRTVRTEVTEKSREWGYELGSVYLRKVHFRDTQMIKEIESKVVNRLRQVTASIRQDGENQVNIITNSANRTASIEFAKAAAIRPRIIGEALQEISADTDVSTAMFEILETQKILENKGELVIIPRKSEMISNLEASVHQ